MSIFLLIPVLAIFVALWLQSRLGRREILRMDLVQFVYAFVLMPIVYVWLKTLIQVLARSNGLVLSPQELFVIDTIFSVVFMVIFAFVVIHSLTKSFQLKTDRDPLYDLFTHSEYYHLELSHLVVYAGAILLSVAISLLNLWLPWTVFAIPFGMFGVISVGVLSGLLAFVGIWRFETESLMFARAMKAMYGISFVAHVVPAVTIPVSFSTEHAVFWLGFHVFLTMVLLAAFAERPNKPEGWWQRLWQRLGIRINSKKPLYYVLFIKNVLTRAQKQTHTKKRR